MTKDRYLEMMSQLGKEPIESEIPPDYEDFPPIVIEAIETFNSLGDRIDGHVGYIGKDYTNLPFYMQIHQVEDKDLFLHILLRLDAEAIGISAKRMKDQVEKMKRKNG